MIDFWLRVLCYYGFWFSLSVLFGAIGGLAAPQMEAPR